MKLKTLAISKSIKYWSCVARSKKSHRVVVLEIILTWILVQLESTLGWIQDNFFLVHCSPWVLVFRKTSLHFYHASPATMRYRCFLWYREVMGSSIDRFGERNKFTVLLPAPEPAITYSNHKPTFWKYNLGMNADWWSSNYYLCEKKILPLDFENIVT